MHIVTLYFGKDTQKTEADRIGTRICEVFSHLALGVVDAGQPNYQYIISLE